MKALWTALLGVILATVALPAAANAQCRLCETPTYTSPTQQQADDVIALEIEAGLDFDQLVVMGMGQGSAEIGTDGTRFAEGAVTAISSRAMVGIVTVRGEAGRRLDVQLPERITLYSTSGDRIVLEAIRHDLPEAPRLDDYGRIEFRFGGRLLIDGGLEGDFRGDIAISVEYL